MKAIQAKASSDPLFARASMAAPDSDANEFMWMPAGVQKINAHQGGREVGLTVTVDQAAAKKIQRQFESVKARSEHKPYFDFDHDDKGASFWPTSFEWREGSGIWCRGEWSEQGLAAIKGRSYRSFSPVFYVDSPKKNPASIICNPEAYLNMGGFVNNPAFKNNLPLWAKQAGIPSRADTHKHMNKTKAELEADIQQLTTDIADLNGRTMTPEVEEAITAKNSELELINAKLETAIAKEGAANTERELTAIRAADAQRSVADAVQRGVFGPKDTDMIAFWTGEITATPSKAAVLGKMPGRVMLGRQPMQLPIQGSRSQPIVGRVQIVRSDNRNVMENLASICARQSPNGGLSYQDRPKVAREFAAIYGREITPRLKEGDDIPLGDLMPIMGANSLGTLAATLVATRTLELLVQDIPMLKAITTDFSDQIVSYGDALKTRIVGIPTVQTFDTTTGWPTNSDVTTTDVTITYNQFKGVPVSFLGHEVAGTIRRLFDEIAPAQAWALGDNMVDYVFALIVAANFTNTATTAVIVDFDRSVVIDIGTALRLRGVPMGPMNRSLILNSDYFGQLAKDAAIVSLATFQRADIITEGVLPNVHGFKVIDSPTLPSTANLTGFGFSKSALVCASRLSADYVNAIPGAGNGNLTVVTTPAGFSANLVQFVNHSAATANSRLEVIYGASAGQDNAGQLLKSA